MVYITKLLELMDKKSLLAIALCCLIYFTWFGWIQKYLPQQSLSPPPTTLASAARVAEVVESDTPPSEHSLRLPYRRIYNSIAAFDIDPETGWLCEGLLFHYLKEDTFQAGATPFVEHGDAVTLENLQNLTSIQQVPLNSVTFAQPQLQLAFDIPSWSYLSKVKGTLLSHEPYEILWRYEDENVVLERHYQTSPEQASLNIQIKVHFKKERPLYAFLSLESKTVSDGQSADRHYLAYSQKKLLTYAMKDRPSQKPIPQPVSFIGLDNKYFMIGLVKSSHENQTSALIQPFQSRDKTEGGRLSLVEPVTGFEQTWDFKVYFGPKNPKTLASVDPDLAGTVDYGWLQVICEPLVALLSWFYSLCHNYGLAIIFLTLLLKILTYPLAFKSMKNFKKMAELQPELDKLKEHYKDDKQQLNLATMQFMKDKGYNPLAGCLPILIQAPVFFSLYRVLYISVDLYQAPLGLWIHDLSTSDPLFILPVLTGIAQYMQQKITPLSQTNPSQAKMAQFMPVLVAAFSITAPSGLALYIFVNTAASMVQQFFMNRWIKS